MRQAGHHATGVSAGLLIAGLTHSLNPSVSLVTLMVVVVAGWYGGVAPDHLEYLPGFPIRWVEHRTLTHWGLAWVAGLAWSTFVFSHHPAIIPAAVFGFTLGGLTHLLCDWPNPTGVPWLWPTVQARHSLRLWTSGTHDFGLSLLAIAIGISPWAVGWMQQPVHGPGRLAFLAGSLHWPHA